MEGQPRHLAKLDQHGYRDAVNALIIVPGHGICTGGEEAGVRVWSEGPNGSWSTAGPPQSLQGPHASATIVDALARTSNYLFVGGEDGLVRVFTLREGSWAYVTAMEGHSDAILSLATSPCGKLFSASYDGSVRVWDASTHAPMKAFRGASHSDAVWCLAASTTLLYSASRDNTVKVWDVKSHKLVATVEGPTGAFCSLAVGGGRLFTGAQGGAVRVWG